MRPQAQRSEGIAIDLLGGFEARLDGVTFELPASAQRVVAFLAIAGRPLRRLHVAGTLWLDSPEPRANAALRTALWRIRQPDCRIVDDAHGCLAIAPEVEVDLRRASDVARRVLAEAAHSPTDEPALPLLWDGGELLPDWYEDWVLVERERHRQLRLHALESVCGALAARGRFAEAIQAGLAAVGSEPLRETAHRALIGAHLAQGNAAEALRQHERFRRALSEGLGLEPSPRMAELVAPLRRRDGSVTTVA